MPIHSYSGQYESDMMAGFHGGIVYIMICFLLEYVNWTPHDFKTDCNINF